MRLNETEMIYASEAMGSETIAQAVDAQAREAANAIREEGGQTDAETRTDAALALAFLDAMPKAWRAKAERGSLPVDEVTGLLDGRKRPKNWQRRCTAIARAALDDVYGRDAAADFAGAPRRIAAAVYGLLENPETLRGVTRAADAEPADAVEALASFLTVDVDAGSGRTLDTRAARTAWAKRGRKPEAALDAALETYFGKLDGSDAERAEALDAALAASAERAIAAVLGREAAKAAAALKAKAEREAAKAASA